MMKFLRRGWYKHKRIGKGKKRMVGWRKPKGRDNKMREKRKGRAAVVSIGYKRQRKHNEAKIVYNVEDLKNSRKGENFIMGRVGQKNKLEIAKKAHEMNIKFSNINIKKILKQNEPK